MKLADEFNIGDIPLVSWILCTHVANDQLKIAIQSCLDQTFKNFELILVVNGPSSEEIFNVIQEWVDGNPRVRVFRTSIRWLNFSLSLGLHYSQGKYIARMDGDDISKRNRLEMQVAYLEAHPEIMVLGSAYEIIDSEGTTKGVVTLPQDDLNIRLRLLRGNPICHPSVIYRRDSVLAAGGYLGGIHSEDYDLWVRLALDQKNIFANMSEILLSYRQTGIGTARRSRFAYASMAGSQFTMFVQTLRLRWIFAAFYTFFKAVIRSRS